MSLRKLASETAWYGVSSIVGRFLNVLLVPLYTNVLTKSEYGVVVDLYATVAFLMVVLSYRMESAFFRFGTPEADRQASFSTGMFSLLGSTAIFATLGLLFAPRIAVLLDYHDHAEYIRYFVLILALDCLAELPFARLRLEGRPRKFALIKLFNIGINIAFNLFWLVFCPMAAAKGVSWVSNFWSSEVGVGYIFLSNLIASAATLLLLLPELWAAVRGSFDKILWKKMMAYAAPLIIVSLAGVVNLMLDRALMKYLLPGTLEENKAQLGIYGANYKLAMLIALFTQAYRYAAEPFFFKNQTEEKALENHANATLWFTIAASGAMLGILCFMEWVKYFIGIEFRSGLQIVPILLVSNVLLGVYYNLSVWYRLKDQTMIGMWITIGGAAITFFLNFWLVPRIGYVGAAWTTVACYGFMCGATWWAGRRHYPVPYPFFKMFFFMAFALGLGLFSLWLQQFFWGRAGLFFLLNVLIFSLFCFVVWRFSGRFRTQI